MNETTGATSPWTHTASPPVGPARGFSIPYIDMIWRVRGEVPVDASLSPDDVFARIAPLLGTPNTTLTVDGGALTYAKHNPAAQDKFATFTRGRMWIERAGAGAVLRFDLFSHALLLCFLAPLLFLGFAQLADTINAYEIAAAKAEPKDKKKDEDKPKTVKKLNPVDEFLGAPAPEDPAKKKKDKKKEDEDEGPHNPVPGYVLAGVFSALYLLGRWLEPWLAKRRLRAALAEPVDSALA